MTAYDTILLLTRWKLNKLGMKCELPKYIFNSLNRKNVVGGSFLKPPALPPPPPHPPPSQSEEQNRPV